jgi:hypothetical protein
MNKKPEIQYKAPKERLLSGNNITTIIKMVIFLAIALCFYGISLQALKYKQPIIATQNQIDSAVVRLVKPDTIAYVKPDTLTIPVEYKYIDSHFTSNGDTTYWFVTGRIYGPKDYFQGVTRAIKLPYSLFNFDEAAKMMRKGDEKANDAIIEYFAQISKATYISYRKYAHKN